MIRNNCIGDGLTMNLIFVNYDADSKDEYDFRSIIKEEINKRNFDDKAEIFDLREKAFDGYRDRYILVVSDEIIIGYLVYGNDKLLKSSIIKYYYFYENYKDDTYVKQVIFEFINRKNNKSTCILHEPDCDFLIQLGFKQSNLRYGDTFFVYFYDDDMVKIEDYMRFIKRKKHENIGSYYYRKMNLIQKLYFLLMMLSLFSGLFIFPGLTYIVETMHSTQPLTLLGITLVSLNIFIAMICIPSLIILTKTAKEKMNYDLKASGFRVKLDYNNMFF